MTRSELIALIKSEAKSRSIAPATLCKKAVDNNRLLKTLEAGGTCTLEVAERFASYIRTHPVTPDQQDEVV